MHWWVVCCDKWQDLFLWFCTLLKGRLSVVEVDLRQRCMYHFLGYARTARHDLMFRILSSNIVIEQFVLRSLKLTFNKIFFNAWWVAWAQICVLESFNWFVMCTDVKEELISVSLPFKYNPTSLGRQCKKMNEYPTPFGMAKSQRPHKAPPMPHPCPMSPWGEGRGWGFYSDRCITQINK